MKGLTHEFRTNTDRPHLHRRHRRGDRLRGSRAARRAARARSPRSATRSRPRSSARRSRRCWRAGTCSGRRRPVRARPPRSPCRCCSGSPDDRSAGDPVALVLVPTRELAVQVSEAFHRYGKDLGARVLPIYGGQPIGRQLQRPGHGRGRRGGHPGPGARPHRPGHPAAGRRGHRGARRGRRDARHGLRRGHRGDPASTPRRSGRRCSSRRPCRPGSTGWPAST